MNVALAVVAVVEVAATVYVITNNKTPKSSAAAAAAPTSGLTASTSAPLGIEGTSAASSPSTNQPVIAFLGDDWTAGVGASSKTGRFSTLVCANLGATELNFGRTGAGYAKRGVASGPYRAEVRAIAAAAPVMVVVSGGRNDYSDNAATAADSATQLFALLRAKLPDAVLVAVAPFWGDSNLPPQMRTLRAQVKQAVTAVGGTYLDIPDPIHGHPDFMADAADPNDQGYAAIAAALEPLLGPLVPR